MKGFIVDADWKTEEDKTTLALFGRLENGQSFAAIVPFEPYFFLKEENYNAVKDLLKEFKAEKTKLTNFKKESVIKIKAENQTNLNSLLHKIHHNGIDTYEGDIKPYMRFVIDNDILGSIDIEGEYESGERIDRVYKNSEIKAVKWKPKLAVVSVDIESDKKTGELICIGIYSEKYKKNFMITEKQLKDTVSCKNEADCLEKWKKEIIKIDPDIITGWNVIDFDLSYLKEKFKKNEIRFDIGRDNSEIRLRIEENYMKNSFAQISGRQVLDGLSLVQDPFIQEAPSIKNAEFESYTLEDVSQVLIGEGKIIKGKHRHDEISRLYKTNPQIVSEYNLQDCKLAYELLEKTDMLNLAIERGMLTGLLLDKLTASIAAFDSLYIREAKKRKLVCPTTHYGLKNERIMGGFVQEPKPGVYKNVIVLDFKSLYPSIIRTFNIDPASFLEKREKDCVEAPNGAFFRNDDGILPDIIKNIHEAREKAKMEKRELASYALKIIQNSFFGVLASPNCRFFNFDMANAITHFGQMIIKLTAEKIRDMEYEVIYSDTDSIFILTKYSKEVNKPDSLLEEVKEPDGSLIGREIQDRINNFYNQYIKEKYNRKSFLELQLDKLFLSLLFPKMRKSESAAKKRYAGLVEKNGKEKLEIVGLEAVRGDWTEAAREFQRELLLMLFKEENVETFIKKFVKKVKSGELDSRLIYRKSIRKALDEYKKITPPHVKAARQLEKLDSNLLEYYITPVGPEPIQKLKHKLDNEHDIEKQKKPIANQILDIMGKNFDELVMRGKQKTLF